VAFVDVVFGVEVVCVEDAIVVGAANGKASMTMKPTRTSSPLMTSSS